MKDQDFITSFWVDQTPEEVFKAIKTFVVVVGRN